MRVRQGKPRCWFEGLEVRHPLAGDLAGLLGSAACELISPGDSPTAFVAETDLQMLSVRQDADASVVWKSALDGSESSPVTSIPGTATGDNFAFDGKLFFTQQVGEGFSGIDPVELWGTDGTEMGTQRLAELGAWDLFGQAVTIDYFDVGSSLLLRVNQSFLDTAATSIWLTDGTPTGTTRIADGFTGMNSGVNDVTRLGDTWLFDAQQSEAGQSVYSLWAVDAATQSAVAVRNFAGRVEELAASDSVAFLVVDAAGGSELWKTDGSDAGSVLVKNVNPSGDAALQDLTTVADTLFFTADDGIHGRELWKSDGTTSGTTLVADLTENGSSDIRDMLQVGEKLFFTKHDADGNVELWSSDGSAGGTAMISPLPGAIQNFTTQFSFPVAAGSSMFFVMSTEETGTELWVSDGTAGGTGLAVDAEPGAGSSNPHHLAVGNNRVLFVAASNGSPTTAWAVEFETDVESQSTTLPGDLNGDDTIDFSDFLLLSRLFGQEVEAQEPADIDGSGTVDFSDFLLLSANFGRKLGE